MHDTAEPVSRADAVAACWDAAHRLTASQRLTITRDDASTDTVWSDPLTRQLETAAYPSNEQKGGSGGGGKPGSRPPVNLDAVALFDEVARACRKITFGVVHQQLGDMVTGSTLAVTARHELAEVLAWTRRLEQWRHRVEQLTGTDPVKIRALPIPCPACGARWVEQLEGDEAPVRTDAVFVEFHGDALQALGCHACGDTWRRGADLDRLVGWAIDTAA